MQNKILILICILFAGAIYFRYASNDDGNNQPIPQNKNNSRKRIQWTKNSPFNEPQRKKKTTKKSKSVYYFSFPKLDKLESTDDVSSFLEQYSIAALKIKPDAQVYYSVLAKDTQIASEILKNVEVHREHQKLLGSLQKNSSIQEIKVLKPQQHYVIHVENRYWLEIKKLRGLWRHQKVNRESSWLSIIYKKTFFELAYASDKILKPLSVKQYSEKQNFYHFLKDVRKQSKEAHTLNAKDFSHFLQKVANLIATTVKLYHETDNLIVNQQLGFYYRNLVYEWDAARKSCAKLYLSMSQKQLDENALDIAAKVYPRITNYKDIAFTYARHNKEDKALQWIQTIRKQDLSEGEYYLAKFYVKRDKAKALKHLEKCFKEGFARFDEVVAPDGGFESLHADSDYQKVLDKYLHNY
ncbi:hypothetical protein [Candidatus Uabimicrobium amorphum]|uniref:Uncharacterized protein n=1 Tax=Uabimicrobium amorphum TaxID=2596890 RepID=A0A5S9IMA2_UABAM|nr:hypothetical protein [Candidatus Uabimicrobium amorphum]BBM83951.1 hypothetical protein UABAM_02306 [Candidatus Uabimicrobium amorphum]